MSPNVGDFEYFCSMIILLSCTGNTLWAAKQLCEATYDRLLHVTEHLKKPVSITLAEGERLGFMFPVHGWRPPKLLREFIKRLHINNVEGHFTYALCTAGDTIGETVKILRHDLSATDITIDSAYSLLMPESYVGLPFMDVDTVEKEQQKISNSQTRLNRIIPKIVNREKGIEELDIGRWPRINSRIIGGYFVNRLVTDRPFHAVKERCSGCGTCARMCPVGNIRMADGNLPEWLHNRQCMACFKCYHHCPRHAIEYGCRTRNKGQYFFGRKH